MIKLKDLMQDIINYFQVIIIDDYEKDREIHRIDELSDGAFLDSDTLYVCNDSSLLSSDNMTLLLSSMDRSPVFLTDSDQTFPFPTVRFNHIPDSDALFFRLNERMKFEAKLQSDISALYQLLHYSNGLEQLVRKFESFLHRPISVLDPSYGMIAVSSLMRQLSFGMESTESGFFLSETEVASLRRLQIEQQIYKRNSAFFISTEDHPDTNWIFCAIRIQNVMSGYVAVAFANKAEASEYEMRLTTAFAEICSIEMQKHEYLMNQTGLQYETFLSELVDGRYSDVQMIESRLRMLNRRFGKFFCLAILYYKTPHNSDLFNKRQMASLRKIYDNSMSVVYKNNIVLLINQDEPVLVNQELTEPLLAFAERHDLVVSLSQPFADILKIRTFYNQAHHTLELGMRMKPDKLLYLSTEALPDYLFSQSNYEELESGIHHHIFQLRDYDEAYHTDLLDTLRAFLDNGRNAPQTASALNIHRSTFFYRLKKIEEVLDIDISDSHLLFLYELSFRIWDYLSR